MHVVLAVPLIVNSTPSAGNRRMFAVCSVARRYKYTVKKKTRYALLQKRFRSFFVAFVMRRAAHSREQAALCATYGKRSEMCRKSKSHNHGREFPLRSDVNPALMMKLKYANFYIDSSWTIYHTCGSTAEVENHCNWHHYSSDLRLLCQAVTLLPCEHRR